MQMYKILSKIGEGGFAKVYIAETEDMTFDLSKLSEELHAIKVFMQVCTLTGLYDVFSCGENRNKSIFGH